MVSVVVVSESELAKVIPNWSMDFVNKRFDKFKQILWDLGGDVYKPWEMQENLTHRNRLNEIVCCNRWVLSERLDKEWVQSKYASREAKNESSGSQLVRDLDPFKYHNL